MAEVPSIHGGYWHEYGRTMRRMFRCEAETTTGERCKRPAAWGWRETPRSQSRRVLCTMHAHREGMPRRG